MFTVLIWSCVLGHCSIVGGNWLHVAPINEHSMVRLVLQKVIAFLYPIQIPHLTSPRHSWESLNRAVKIRWRRVRCLFVRVETCCLLYRFLLFYLHFLQFLKAFKKLFSWPVWGWNTQSSDYSISQIHFTCPNISEKNKTFFFQLIMLLTFKTCSC